MDNKRALAELTRVLELRGKAFVVLAIASVSSLRRTTRLRRVHSQDTGPSIPPAYTP